MATQRRLSHREIAALLLEMECGMSQAAAAAAYGVSKSALTAWKHYMGLNEKWLGRVKWLEHEIKK